MNSKLTAKDFGEALGGEISGSLAKKIEDYNFEYAEVSPEERDACLVKIINKILDPKVDQSGDHRLDIWEKGWGENLSALKDSDQGGDALTPRYFSKTDYGRWGGRLIKTIGEKFEYNTLSVIVYYLLEKYGKAAKSLYEFGCGTGHHLLRMREINKTAKIYGLDWAEASQKIIGEMVGKGILDNAEGRRFDFFNPDKSFEIDPEGVVFTIAALEQVGEKHKDFVDYLVSKKPGLCIHIEPVAELLDERVLLDYLSTQYIKKRNYLSGFLDNLRDLEKAGKVEIVSATRNKIGHLFLEGYMIIVWRAK